MKKAVVSLNFLLVSVILSSQELTQYPDSLSHELEEITVKAAPVIRKIDRSIYTVEDALKQRSTSTLNLLNNLQIPQLTVNDLMETVTSSLGAVQIRVNGREVTVADLKMINQENVQKIEWIDNPGLRYGNDTGAVINIIVRNPTAGGSFMINGTQSLSAGYSNASTNLTINNGASQWTIGGWLSNRNHIDMFREYTDKYRLSDGSVLNRTQNPLDGYFTKQSASPTISYNYMRSDSINFYIGVNYFNQWCGDGVYNGLLEGTLSRTEEKMRLTEGWDNTNKYPWMNIYFERKLRGGSILIFNATGQISDQYGRTTYREFNETNQQETVNIDNSIDNRTWNYGLEGNYIKNFGKVGQLSGGVRYTGSKGNTTYLNQEDYEIQRISNRIYFFGEYMLSVGKITFTGGLGGIWTQYYVGNQEDNESKLHFVPRLSVNWRASDHSRWSLSYRSGVTTPSATSLSPVTQQIDDIQIERGNPDLKSYLSHYLMLRYNFSNYKNLNISASFDFSHQANIIQPYYTWEGAKILRSYSNDGYYNTVFGSIDVSYEPVMDWIRLSASIMFTHDWNKGRGFRHRLTSWGQNFDISVSHWNWTLQFQLYNPRKDLWGETVTKNEFYNVLSINYHWKQWNFGAGILMPFGRYNNTKDVIADLVQQNTINRTNSFQRMPFLTFSYNVNWGQQKRGAQRRLSGNASNGGGVEAAGR